MSTRKDRTPPAALLLDVHAVAILLACSWRTVFKLAQTDRRFPPSVRLGGRCRRWLRSEVERYVADLERDEPPARRRAAMA